MVEKRGVTEKGRKAEVVGWSKKNSPYSRRFRSLN